MVALQQEVIRWKIVHDIGDISNARGMEMYLPLWVRLFGVFKQPMFNIHIAKV